MRLASGIVSIVLVTAVIARVAMADGEGGTLITATWDSGAPASDAAPVTPITTTPVPVATAPVVVQDAGAPVANPDAGAPATDNSPTKYRGSIDAYYKYTGLDLDISGGGGYHWGTNDQKAGIAFGRVRGGIMHVSWPFMYAVGATYEINNMSPAAWGAQAEILHIGAGIWAQVGASVDYKAQFAGIASVGWSMLGIEAQIRGYKDALPFTQPNDFGYGFTLVGKIRIPVGFILYVLSRK